MITPPRSARTPAPEVDREPAGAADADEVAANSREAGA